MPSDVTRDEFKQVVTRLDVVERGLQDKRAMMRQILELTLHDGDVLANMRTDVKGMRTDMASMRTGLMRLDRKLDLLARKIPKVVGDAVRKALHERKR